MIMMMGDSTRTARENATPKAAKLSFGTAKRAIIAEISGPSTAIINQVAANGTQKKKIRLLDSIELYHFYQYFNHESLNKAHLQVKYLLMEFLTDLLTFCTLSYIIFFHVLHTFKKRRTNVKKPV